MRKFLEVRLLVCLLLVIVILYGHAFAQEDVFLTNHEWAVMSEEAKLTYLLGLGDGTTMTAIVPSTAKLKSLKLTHLELIVYLDAFYANPKNATVGLPFVLHLIDSELRGISSEKNEANIQVLRGMSHLDGAMALGLIERGHLGDQPGEREGP